MICLVISKDIVMAPLKYIALFVFIASNLSAEKLPCGIIANRMDFASGKITYTFDGCRFDVMTNKDIVAHHLGNKVRFDFQFIYGYSDGKNLYRAYGVQSLLSDFGFYKVIYDSDVVVYSRVSRDYRSNLQTFYYFSHSKESPILPLRRRFYSQASEIRGAIRLHVSKLKSSIGIPGVNDEPNLEQVTLVEDKSDVSARLETTARRPKI
jgi:hypothetical protein